MTSNLGTSDLKRKNIGFAADGEEISYAKIKEKVTEALKKQFRPEFLNRIDEVIVFHELTMDEVKAIVDLMLVRVREQLKSQALDLVLTDAAKAMLGAKGYDPQLGARPLRRAIQRMLEDPLSEKVLFGEFPANSTVLVDLDPDDADLLTFAPVETPDQPPLEMAESEG
jgi:ATP-dependent Clp protease ATP-binding subunit ClpC